jgi:hypothetical protein
VDISVVLDGKPWPDSDILRDVEWKPPVPKPARVFYASAEAVAEGDGSEAKPWKDLQAALCRLKPGDQLVLAAGSYRGSFVIGGTCSDGTAEAPIHLTTRGGMLQQPTSKEYVLKIEKSHWYVEGPQMVLNELPVNAVVVGSGAHDVVLERLHVFEGKGSGVVIGQGTSNITISNSHIHHFNGEPPALSAGIVIHPGTSGLRLIRNHLHHNRGGSIRTIGAPAKGESGREQVENLQIVDNKLHDDHDSAIVLAGVRGARIATNKIYNYRPVGRFSGAAITVGDAFKVGIEQNHFAESTIGIQIGDPGGADDDRIQHVFVYRNYLENRLTRESTAFKADAGRGVHIFNNVVDRYATPLVLRGGGAKRAGTAVANNLFIEPVTAFDAPQLRDMRLFDYNIFSVASGSLSARIGSETRPIGDLVSDGSMSNSRLVRGGELENRDLGRIVGLTLVDAGTREEGISHQGSAPDIGVAER